MFSFAQKASTKIITLFLREKELDNSLHSSWSASSSQDFLCAALKLSVRASTLEFKLMFSRRSLASRTIRSSNSRSIATATGILAPRPFPHVRLLVGRYRPASQDLPHRLSSFVLVADQLHRLLLPVAHPPRTLVGQHPDVAGALLRLRPLPEVGVHAQVVSHAVLPPVVLGLVVGEVLSDPVVDPGHGERRLVLEGEGDEVSVGVVGLALILNSL